jgi:Kef-type K+ transport system membrane component KefB/Trk K+ transport system NAD-binding subunit
MDLFLPILVFGIVVLAADRIGKLGSIIHLPLITGFLLAGILVGPYGLVIVTKETLGNLNFINHLALAVIAMAAGNELVLKEFRSRFRSIAWVTIAQAITTLALGTIATFLLSSNIPFTRELSPQVRLAISLLAGIILVARSPSSAIAIINEMRAKGPFTQTVLGVTVVMDVAVIVLFAIGSEFAHAINSNLPFSITFAGLLLLEITLSILGGCVLWKFVAFITSRSLPRPVKSIILLSAGMSVFVCSNLLRDYSHDHWNFELFLEPLLLCMIAGLLVSNTSPHRVEFTRILHQIGPPVYLAFFTLTGVSIELDVLAEMWPLALVLFAVRLAGIFLGTYAGSFIVGDPPRHRAIGWMSYVTQAGIGIALALEIKSEFAGWGSQLATLLIAVIVFNQLIGPPLMKWSLMMTGEGRTRADTPAFDGVMDAVIFGTAAGQSWVLAHRLESHGWNVKLAVLDDHTPPKDVDSDIEVIRLKDLSQKSFEVLELVHADALIALLTDDQNLQICQLNYDQYGIERMLVKLHDVTTDMKPFQELDALVVNPRNAMVRLLEHFVLSPTGTSMLLGMEPDQEVLEIELRDSSLHGLFIRDLKIPLDLLVLSVTRDGKVIITHGFNRLRIGDHLTVVGPPQSLSEAELYFSESHGSKGGFTTGEGK